MHSSSYLKFPQWLRKAKADTSRASIIFLGIGVILFFLWLGLFFYLELPLYETAGETHLENFEQSHFVEAEASGKIKKNYLEVGNKVKEGQVLLELDTRDIELKLREKIAGLERAKADLELQSELARRQKILSQANYASKVDFERQRTLFKKSGADVRAYLAEVEMLQLEKERHRIISPISGTVAERRPWMNLGTLVKREERIATIVPETGLRGVSFFNPESTLGRIKPGQKATLSLYGFPWAEFGRIRGTVTQVGSATRNGKVEVIFSLDTQDFKVPLQDGFMGEVEIEVDRVSPFQLVLRSLGQQRGKSRQESNMAP